MGDGTHVRVDEGHQPDDDVTSLVKARILTELARFTSTVAMRFYYSEIFPRASRASNVPNSLDDLIVQAVERTSVRLLRVSSSRKHGVTQSPKEAVFHQLFHESIASLLPVSYRIIPELGTEAKIDGNIVTGELDFYIKKGNKWALELHRGAKGRKEHLERIPGKYRVVEADSWLVVDCRTDGVVPSKRNNLCTLVFSDDFRSCQCYLRGNAVVTIKLAE